MKTRLILAGAAGFTTLLLSTIAGAQPKDVPLEAGAGVGVPKAPSNALELKIGMDYSQGFGGIGSGISNLTDLGTAGGAINLGLGYRLDPHLMLGIYGSGAEFGRGSNVDSSANLFTATAGLEANWHFLPQKEWDPFVGLGTGWRGYWISTTPGTASLQGWQIARLDLGVDYRMADYVSIAPVIGADLSMFFTSENVGQSSYYSLSAPNLDTFVYAGLLGRFDIGLGPSSRVQTAAR
jgi:hypothetical protein